MREILRSIYRRPEQVEQYKIKIIHAIKKCLLEPQFKSFSNYMLTGDNTFLETIALGPKEKKIYDSLRYNPYYGRLTDVDGQDVLKILCINPDDYSMIKVDLDVDDSKKDSIPYIIDQARHIIKTYMEYDIDYIPKPQGKLKKRKKKFKP